MAMIGWLAAFVILIGIEAGTMALEQRKHLSSAGLHFKNERDLVTDVDRQVENFIKTNISQLTKMVYQTFDRLTQLSVSLMRIPQWIGNPQHGKK